MFPEELDPPPCFTSFGSGLLAPDWAASTLITGISVPPHPSDNAIANPKRVAVTVTRLTLITASPSIKSRGVDPDAGLRCLADLDRSGKRRQRIDLTKIEG
jgi:hypothetical protein